MSRDPLDAAFEVIKAHIKAEYKRKLEALEIIYPEFTDAIRFNGHTENFPPIKPAKIVPLEHKEKNGLDQPMSKQAPPLRQCEYVDCERIAKTRMFGACVECGRKICPDHKNIETCTCIDCQKRP